MLDIRRRTGYLFLAIVIGHVILISAQVPSRSGPKVLQAVVLGAFSGVARMAATVTGSASTLWSRYVDLRGVRAHNERLTRQIADLQVELLEQRALAQRAAGLQALLDLRTQVALPTLAAQVIAGDATPGFQMITIDRGSTHGVRRDMAVIEPGGVVGRVMGEPAALAAQVQLIIGRGAAAGAMIERSRAMGVVIGGAGEPPLALEYISNLTDVREGDVVVTSGNDGIYPKGFPIGQVVSATRGPSLYQLITVQPVVDFSSLEEVLVITAPAGPGGEQ